MKYASILLFVILFFTSLEAQRKTENVVFITLDGFRWQELFGGAVDSLMNDLKYVKDTASIHQKFAGETKQIRREKLLPWFWSHIGKQGQIYGNRWHGNLVNCTNVQWFSYPGYNEILTGFSDPYVNSNDKKYNQNVTVLEWLHQKEEFAGKIAAFCSWDVFPYIINDVRSGIPVNVSENKSPSSDWSSKEILLNQIQDEVPVLYANMRLDVFTHHLALGHMQRNHPRVVYIAYGETDDFAHDGRYDHYLNSAYKTDKWIGEVWDYLQSDPFYKDKTTLLITTDHGRGTSPKDEWRSHGKIFHGSPEIWMAVMGPDTPPTGEVLSPGRNFQNQVASTLARFLGYEYHSTEEIGASIESMFNQTSR